MSDLDPNVPIGTLPLMKLAEALDVDPLHDITVDEFSNIVVKRYGDTLTYSPKLTLDQIREIPDLCVWVLEHARLSDRAYYASDKDELMVFLERLAADESKVYDGVWVYGLTNNAHGLELERVWYILRNGDLERVKPKELIAGILKAHRSGEPLTLISGAVDTIGGSL